MNDIIKALYERKSVRVFSEKEIIQKEKECILNAALQAPSAGCQLLYTILDITDEKKKEKLAELCDHQVFAATAGSGFPFIKKPGFRPERLGRGICY